MTLIEYDEKYRQDFIDFNTAWIEDNFGHLDPEDYETFEHIEDELKDGAMIYFAIDDDGTALPTRILLHIYQVDESNICI